jgi:hypothetical protein
VGLVKREFYILNVPYTREAYFEAIKDLGPQLGIRSTP